jgi:hypothetical protein
MPATPRKGAKVRWNTAQGETTGVVEKTVTKTTKVKGYTAKATKDAPQVLVRSSKTGKQAVHRPEELKKAK